MEDPYIHIIVKIYFYWHIPEVFGGFIIMDIIAIMAKWLE